MIQVKFVRAMTILMFELLIFNIRAKRTSAEVVNIDAVQI